MKIQATPLRLLFLTVFLITASQLLMATPCIWKKKQVIRTEAEDAKIAFKTWMFDDLEWETNERIYLRSWMYVVTPLSETSDFNIQEWMLDISQGWVTTEISIKETNKVSA